jgi:hypothetical protein
MSSIVFTKALRRRDRRHENNKNWIMTQDFFLFFSGTWKLCFERKDVDSMESKLAQFMDDNKKRKFSP